MDTMPFDLKTIGEALYGERWQSSLARALEVSDRTMRRWDAGEFNVPHEMQRAIRRHACARIEIICDALKERL